MNNKEFHIILEKYLNGQSTIEEEKIINSFYKNRLQKNDGIDSWKEEERISAKLRGLNVLQKHINKPGKNVPIFYKRWFKIAASIFIMLGIGFLSYLSSNLSEDRIKYITKNTNRGQKSTIILSDGTTVRLNSESSISFPVHFEDSIRHVSLIGEAFFEVSHNQDKPFIVSTDQIKTRVLGTSFNINAYPEGDDVQVTLATGSIQLETIEQNKIILTPGEQAIFDKHSSKLERKEVDISKFIAWNSNKIILDDIKLSEAAKLLERWFDVEISFENPNLGNCFIKGSYENESLKNILESFRFVKGLDYQFIQKNKVMIKGNICL